VLNKLLKQLNGHGSDAESLDAALIQLEADRETAQRELSDLQVRRHQALLDDATDATLDKLEREIERAETRIEKLDLAAPGLRERLDAARQDARRRRWEGLLSAWRQAAAEFVSSARATVAAHESLVSLRAAAQSEGFAAEAAAHMPATPNLNGHALLAPDLLDIFEQSMRPPVPDASATRPAIASSSRARARLPHERVPHGDVHGSVSLDFISAPRPRPTRVVDDVEPLLPGEVRAVVVRPGLEVRGQQCAAGQKIRLQADDAERCLRSGSIEITERAPLTQAGENL